MDRIILLVGEGGVALVKALVKALVGEALVKAVVGEAVVKAAMVVKAVVKAVVVPVSGVAGVLSRDGAVHQLLRQAHRLQHAGEGSLEGRGK